MKKPKLTEHQAIIRIAEIVSQYRDRPEEALTRIDIVLELAGLEMLTNNSFDNDEAL